MSTLILVRHGQSTWNFEGKFTGWVDVDLTDHGIAQAKAAGDLIKKFNLLFDVAYTSVLKRAIRTLWHIQDATDLMWVPVVSSWRLNERHYGALSGLNKSEVANQYGDEQVLLWRRSYEICPPKLVEHDSRCSFVDPRYTKLRLDEIPTTECLRDTTMRVLPIWQESIVQDLRLGKTVIIVAHGNSIRALMKHLESISDQDILELNIANAMPYVYKLDENMKPITKYSIKE